MILCFTTHQDSDSGENVWILTRAVVSDQTQLDENSKICAFLSSYLTFENFQVSWYHDSNNEQQAYC